MSPRRSDARCRPKAIVESIDCQQIGAPFACLQIERYDRLIEEAETRLAEQEAYVREVALVSGSTAVASFELQKMHLLIALLREGRRAAPDAPAQ